MFGRTEERRTERALIGEYRACIDELLRTLNAGNLPLAVEIARIPEEIRGYGHVKERHLQAARAKWDGLMAQWRAARSARRPERVARLAGAARGAPRTMPRRACPSWSTARRVGSVARAPPAGAARLAPLLRVDADGVALHGDAGRAARRAGRINARCAGRA